jgi:hypothetical protein
MQLIRFSLLTLFSLSIGTAATAVTLIDNDFESGLGDFTITGSGAGLVDVDPTAGVEQELQFTDNSTTGSEPRAVDTFGTANISTTASGNNLLTGSFDFVLPQTTDTYTPAIDIYLNAGQDSLGANNSLFVIRLRDGQVQLRDDTSSNSYSAINAANTTTALALVGGTSYTIDFSADLSSTRDTYSLSVSNTLTNGVLASETNRLTLADDITPDRLVLNGGILANAVDADPFVRIDNVQLEANPVPEPGSLVLLGVGTLLITSRRRG